MLSIGTQKSDRITTITNTTWAEYISLDLQKLRVLFRNGVIQTHPLFEKYDCRLIIPGDRWIFSALYIVSLRKS